MNYSRVDNNSLESNSFFSSIIDILIFILLFIAVEGETSEVTSLKQKKVHFQSTQKWTSSARPKGFEPLTP